MKEWIEKAPPDMILDGQPIAVTKETACIFRCHRMSIDQHWGGRPYGGDDDDGLRSDQIRVVVEWSLRRLPLTYIVSSFMNLLRVARSLLLFAHLESIALESKWREPRLLGVKLACAKMAMDIGWSCRLSSINSIISDITKLGETFETRPGS